MANFNSDFESVLKCGFCSEFWPLTLSRALAFLLLLSHRLGNGEEPPCSWRFRRLETLAEGVCPGDLCPFQDLICFKPLSCGHFSLQPCSGGPVIAYRQDISQEKFSIGNTATKIPLMYSFSGNSAASAPISTFMCL